jgi:hypothetical protein
MLIGYARVSTARQGEYQESSPALSMANLEAAIKARIAYIKALPDASV